MAVCQRVCVCVCVCVYCLAIQMGRPSKSRSDTSTNAPYDQRSTSPVNLSFHAGAGTSGVVEQNGPAAGLEVSAALSQRDVVSQQPDSTADCSPPSGAGLALSSRKRSTINVLRQLQSQSAAASHAAVIGKQSSSSALWPDCGENVAMIDVAADLRIKRARHSVQSPVRLVQSLTGTGGVRVADLSRTGECWSLGDTDSCTAAAAAAVYDTAVASPSVTSSGRRDSVDDDDDDDDEDIVMTRDCATWMTACPPPSSAPAACSVDLRRHITRRSSADQPAKKLAG